MALDFMKIATKEDKKGSYKVYPVFVIGKSDDLMIRGGDFYAIWVEERKLWSTEEQDVINLVDRELSKELQARREKDSEHNWTAAYMWSSESGSIDAWHKYVQKQSRDMYHPLDETLIFSDTETTRESYASKKLPYPLLEGTHEAWDRIVGTLYSDEERHKIEWAIGSIVAGESKKLQKFMVLYGNAGTGKSTVLDIIAMLFEGYVASFEAKTLGSANSSFALEQFKTNPLVAIQHDGDLSRIEDNTRLNSLVSHEKMVVNEKFKSTYETKFNAFLFMGTNKPVKITDAKSGLTRRLIDVNPSRKLLERSVYDQMMANVPFELGAIAYHCKQVYLDNPRYYDKYVPIAMIGATNDFFNFVEDNYFEFKRDDSITLRDAWDLYKIYCDDAKVAYPYPRRSFKEELKNYFETFEERGNGEDRRRNIYSGFLADKFEGKKNDIPKTESTSTWLIFKDQHSLLDDYLADCLAQYSNEAGKPSKKWDKVKTKLKDLDTSKLHYVAHMPYVQVIVDFDIPDENGNKCLEKNIEAASKFPPTYAELSKSGEGIHLHYIYTGDVDKLAHVYAEHIEIKTYPGDASLRRLVTKCNDIPLTTISGGLPLKGEKKMVNQEMVQTEKGLRTTIAKCLMKGVHPGTKPNVDFIYDILEKAYNSGIAYDVMDTRQAVLQFALGSTNQSDYCVKLVNKMHFKSEEAAPPEFNNYNDEIVFYDIEIFPNLFVVNWKKAGIDNPVVRMINPSKTDLEQMCKFKLIGFNNRSYDNHMIYAAMMGYSTEELYRLSGKLIGKLGKEVQRNAKFSNAFNLSYSDVYDFASAGNKMSLKKWEIKLSKLARDPNSKMDDDTRALCQKIKHHELGLDWDAPVPEELWTKVAEYCDDDVLATEATFNYLSADWTARQILADLAGMTSNDTTNTLTTKIIFGANRSPQNEFHYRNLAEPVPTDPGKCPYDEEDIQFLTDVFPEMMSEPHGDAKSLLPYFPGYKFEFGKSSYRGEEFGEGGYVYSEPGTYGNVALLDIASMHPHSTMTEVLFGARFTKAYHDIVYGRVNIKHKAWDIVSEMLDGKLKPYIEKVERGEMSHKDLANALKTAINSVYGLTSAKFKNPFKDDRNIDNIVAKRGELFMIDLKHEVQKRGFTVAHIKTDSIKIPDATPEIIQFVMDFGKRYGYSFEHEATYDRMCLVNKAVYIARYKTAEECEKLYGYIPGDNSDHPWQWTATGDQFAVPYIFKTLFTDEEIVFDDLCETFQVSKGALYLDMNEGLPDVSALEKELDKLETRYRKGEISDTTIESERMRLEPEIAKGHNYKFVGRVGEFVPVKAGEGGGVLYRIDNGKKYAAAGSTGYRWIESDTLRELGVQDKIDMSYFDDLANKAEQAIIEYGFPTSAPAGFNSDFEWFVSDEPYSGCEYAEGWYGRYPIALPFV